MSYLYFWGRPIIQQHKRSQTKPNIHCIETNQLVEQVSCGLQHAFLVTETNEVYGMGSNSHGQCGAGYLKDVSINEIQIPTKSKIVSISCGWYHTIILDQMGCVFTAGSGTQGATGQGHKQNTYTFKQVMTGAKKISAGMDHSLAIKGSKVYGWGSNDYGQLGLHTKKNYFAPQQLNIYPCNQLSSGNKYSIFITVKGVYGCGLNNNYQLGLGHEKTVTYPKAINVDYQLVNVYCGNYSVGRTKSNSWFIWGSGAFGTFRFPTKASFFQGCEKVSLGVSFGMMLKNDKIFVWGSNNFGQLGTQIDYETKEYAHESNNLSEMRLAEFSCGVNFGIGISHQYRESYTNKSDESQQSCSNQQQMERNNNKNNIYENQNNMKINNKSSKTHYNTNHTNSEFIIDNKNSKMRTVYTDYGGYQQKSPQLSYYNGGKMINTKMGKSNIVYSNNVVDRQLQQERRQINGKALSDQAIKRKSTQKYSSHTNQQHNQHQSLHQYPVNYQSQQQNHNNNKPSQQQLSNKGISTKTKQQQQIQNANIHKQENKQNWQNIQKLRKAIVNNQQKQGKNSQSHSSSSNSHDNNNDRLKNVSELHEYQQKEQQKFQKQHQRQFQQFGQNLERLKQLLNEAKMQNQISSSNQHQSN